MAKISLPAAFTIFIVIMWILAYVVGFTVFNKPETFVPYTVLFIYPVCIAGAIIYTVLMLRRGKREAEAKEVSK
jgi:1,4-dihydroxy-2-naphthoate octaprenyltransferase